MPVMEKEKSTLNVEQEEILEYAKKIEQNNAEDKRFADSLDEYLQNKERTTDFITVGTTSNALSLAGANAELNVVIAPRTIAKCMSEADEHYHGHGLSDDIMKQIPLELRNPTMILKGNKDNSLVAITALKDKENREIMIAVSLSERRKRHEVNRVSSIYGRNNMANYLKAQIEQGNLIAANTEKANEMFQSAGLQLPLEETFISFDNSIAYSTANVKYPEQNISEISQFHDTVPHDKLLPFLNAKANFHQNRLDTLKDKRDTRTAKIEKNTSKIEKLSAKADRLEDMNKILSSLGNIPAFNLLIRRNEERIKAIREEKIPNRQNKIDIHKKKILEIDKKSSVIGHKLERAVALNDTIKSFGLTKGRREAFCQAMDKLHKSTHLCLVDKLFVAQDKLRAAKEAYSRANADQKVNRLKAMDKCQNRLDMLNDKIAKFGSELYKFESAENIDNLIENTTKIINDKVVNGDMSVSGISEEVCQSNHDLLQSIRDSRQRKLQKFSEIINEAENPLKNGEMALEDNYNSIDGVLNNGSDKPKEQTQDVDNTAPEDSSRNAAQNDFEKINPDYYNFLNADERVIVTFAGSVADKVLEELEQQQILHSAIKSRNNGNTTITVSTADETAIRKIEKSVKSNYFEKRVNPEVYQNIKPEDRFTQVMPEDKAVEVLAELDKNGIEHSGVLKGDNSKVTIDQKDFRKSGFIFSMKKTIDQNKAILDEQKKKNPPQKSAEKNQKKDEPNL